MNEGNQFRNTFLHRQKNAFFSPLEDCRGRVPEGDLESQLERKELRSKRLEEKECELQKEFPIVQKPR